MTTHSTNKPLRLAILSIFFILHHVSPPTTSSASPTIYDALTTHGLPMGILPKGVTNYTLANDGQFVIHLDQPCNAKFESEIHYDRNVTGWLETGQIRNLTGLSAQELFLWFPVKGIRVDIPSSGLIYFDVGVVFKRFSLSLFETPPDCVADAAAADAAASSTSHPRTQVHRQQNGRKGGGALSWRLSNSRESGRESI